MSGQTPVLGVNELVLEVADLEHSERFYAGKLGLPVVERWPARNAVWIRAGQTRIGLWRPQVGLEGSRGGVHVHFAMRIADDDFDAYVGTLRERGLDVRLRDFPGTDDFPGRSRSAYVTDPDDHLVEFWTAAMSAYDGAG